MSNSPMKYRYFLNWGPVNLHPKTAGCTYFWFQNCRDIQEAWKDASALLTLNKSNAIHPGNYRFASLPLNQGKNKEKLIWDSINK